MTDCLELWYCIRVAVDAIVFYLLLVLLSAAYSIDKVCALVSLDLVLVEWLCPIVRVRFYALVSSRGVEGVQGVNAGHVVTYVEI